MQQAGAQGNAARAAALSLVLAATMVFAGSAELGDQDRRDAFREGQLWAAYALDPVMSTTVVVAEVRGDTVVLGGAVRSEVEAELAEAIALAVEGVVQVDNRLRIDPELPPVLAIDRPAAFARDVTDASLVARVRRMLDAHPDIARARIDVQASDQVVVLLGVTPTPAVRWLAEQLAQSDPGVFEVDNRIVLSEPSSAALAEHEE